MRFTGIIKGFFNRLGEAVFPAVCECCGRSLVDGERLLCLHCRYEMPRTGYHLSLIHISEPTRPY